MINSRLKQRYTQEKSKQEQSRKQNNLITLIKYNLKSSFQEKEDKESKMFNGYIDTHNIYIFFILKQLIYFQVRPNVNHKMNTNTNN
jgi:hypothetical protein